jgi:diguanylate cyclase (GGDEF)-like protein
MSRTAQNAPIMQPDDVSCEIDIDDSPTQLVRRILKPHGPTSHAVNAGEEDTTATVMTVMLRVQPPPGSLLMVGAEHGERLRLALHVAGFDVAVASSKEQALGLMASRHHALAVTNRLDLVGCFRELGTSRLLQIIAITGTGEWEADAALLAGADECLDANASETLLQARFAAARRTGDLESALRTAFVEGRRLATTDELTGVANRRFFAIHYPREILRAARFGHPIAVAMCDIDYFKRVNDQYGHAAGDAVLRQCAQRIQQRLRRGTDWIARLGGEEFAVVMPETGLDKALLVGRTLREEISKEPFCSNGTRMRVTASIGVAAIESVFRKPKKLPERLLSAADRALYRCKEAGRDRVAAVRLRFGRR